MSTPGFPSQLWSSFRQAASSLVNTFSVLMPEIDTKYPLVDTSLPEDVVMPTPPNLLYLSRNDSEPLISSHRQTPPSPLLPSSSCADSIDSTPYLAAHQRAAETTCSLVPGFDTAVKRVPLEYGIKSTVLIGNPKGAPASNVAVHSEREKGLVGFKEPELKGRCSRAQEYSPFWE
ncbi:unnamed protein product, partial [Protopolystoma xenopodis]